MSSIQSAEDQSGKWAIVNMPALDGIDGSHQITQTVVVQAGQYLLTVRIQNLHLIS